MFFSFIYYNKSTDLNYKASNPHSVQKKIFRINSETTLVPPHKKRMLFFAEIEEGGYRLGHINLTLAIPKIY